MTVWLFIYTNFNGVSPFRETLAVRGLNLTTIELFSSRGNYWVFGCLALGTIAGGCGVGVAGV